MAIVDNIKLVIKGVPIVTEYTLTLSESSFVEVVESMLVNEDDLNPFSLPSKRFIGYFHGYYRREFSIKLKSSVFRSDTLSNSIWIHGQVEQINEQKLSLIVTYHRTNFAKLGQWVLLGSLGLILLILGINAYEMMRFLIFTGAIFFFYLAATFIRISQTNSQIVYFENHFIKEIRNKEKSMLSNSDSAF